MKTAQLFFGILLYLATGCSNSTVEVAEPIPLSKEEKIKRLFIEKVIPLYRNYTDIKIPLDFKIDKKDLSINAGAAFGYIEVSQGLIDYEKEHIQLYVLAHEVSHIVTLNQAKKFNLGTSIPRGTITNEYKKSEYLADLIAIHLINTKLKEQLNLISNDFTLISNLLGSKSFTHPSNKERVDKMKAYLNESLSQKDPLAVFKQKFEKIWKMD